MTRRVLLAGEGKTELGGWAGDPVYVDSRPRPGMLEALLAKVAPEGWEIVAAYEWKRLPRYRANEPGLGKDELNTKALRVFAGDHGCDLIVFSRDRDRAVDRAIAVNRGLAWLRSNLCSGLEVIGGMAHECSESWLLAVHGEARSEEHAPVTAKQRLHEMGVSHTDAMVAAIEAADLSTIPADAVSLRAWLSQAQAVFPSPA